VNKYYVIYNKSYIFDYAVSPTPEYVRVAEGPYNFKEAVRRREIENNKTLRANAVVAKLVINGDGEEVK